MKLLKGPWLEILLHHLTNLCIDAPNPESLPQHFHVPNLQKFHIAIGAKYHSMHSWPCYPSSNILQLEKIERSLPQGVMDMIQTTAELKLKNLRDEVVKSIIDVDQGGLSSLKSLTVYDCMETVFMMDVPARDAPALLANLDTLRLVSLNNMEDICRSSLPEGSLHKLKTLKVGDCDELDPIVTGIMLLRLLSLEEIEVGECDKATHIFGHIGTAITGIETRLLSNLRRIILWRLSELQEIWIGLNPESPAISLNKLTVVDIYKCGKLSYIFPACVAESLVLLQVIRLEWCSNLKSIVAKGTQGNQPVYFSNLRAIKVEECTSLKSLFSVAEARNLRHLKTIEVRNSDNMTELISHDDTGRGGESMIRLPKLSTLRMKDLSNMSRGMSLEELVIEECPLMVMEVVKSIFGVDRGLSSLKSLTVEGCKETVFMMDVPAPDAPALLSHLDTLRLSNLRNMEDICRSSLPEGSLHKLETLMVKYCEKLDPIVTGLMLLRLLDLEEIEVSFCDKATHIFGHIGTAITGTETRFLSNLTRINLERLPELQEIWIGLNPESPAISLNKLTEVEISYCTKLSYIFPACVAESLSLLELIKLEGCLNLKSIVAKGTQGNQPVYFSNLRVIEVGVCTSLESLFSVAEARNLRHLKTIKVGHSSNITELISHDDTGGGGGESTILLPKLSTLQMEDLSNMSRLCAKSFIVDLPSLEELVIEECPLMESNGVDLTKLGVEDLPMLKRAQIGGQKFNGEAIKHLFISSGKKNITNKEGKKPLEN